MLGSLVSYHFSWPLFEETTGFEQVLRVLERVTISCCAFHCFLFGNAEKFDHVLNKKR